MGRGAVSIGTHTHIVRVCHASFGGWRHGMTHFLGRQDLSSITLKVSLATQLGGALHGTSTLCYTKLRISSH
jgi:hypothetical protein